jgi:hypothetical protein
VIDPCSPLEGGIHEPVGFAVDLALREGPQLDDLHPTRQGIGKRPQRKDPRGSREEETARGRVQVDGHLDRAEQLRRVLYLVNDEEPVVVHELRGVVARRLQGRRIVQETYDRTPCRAGREPSEGALPRLARTVHQDDARVLQGVGHQTFSSARE